ncbi:MAG: hypothetical protein ACI4M3_05575 [Acutalibacteraceae bacterium]
MDEDTAWRNFISSGSVADYLVYCTAKRQAATHAEEHNENQHGRSDFEGTNNRGTGQIAHNFDAF